ncbi:uncharacterized protein EV420DRAFT_1482223 [Desarmillaria tabescens]|uniref:Uncharacterized protein n=1 Tax=Armillaria tabescens TaxID=1929756 RepID=A0AA39K051_ARMTA|nr:uncharacterized protein EV420DRAFT_1482223 [Desarmillaria tabescens]KAK0452137.1 hypothetical protein EV420DRAFT_1482223 [Desarmillaria tabescens]
MDAVTRRTMCLPSSIIIIRRELHQSSGNHTAHWLTFMDVFHDLSGGSQSNREAIIPHGMLSSSAWLNTLKLRKLCQQLVSHTVSQATAFSVSCIGFLRTLGTANEKIHRFHAAKGTDAAALVNVLGCPSDPSLNPHHHAEIGGSGAVLCVLKRIHSLRVHTSPKTILKPCADDAALSEVYWPSKRRPCCLELFQIRLIGWLRADF